MKILQEIKRNKKYCVFFHTDMDGVPFYLGCATVRRAYKLEKSRHNGEGTNRSKAYKEKIHDLNYEYKVNIIEYFDNKEDAKDLLYKLYSENKTTLLSKEPKKRVLLDRDYLAKHFYIDASSRSGLSLIETGDQAGHIVRGKRGDYYSLNLKGVSYLVHRIILCLSGHDLNDKIVDHMDGNSLNNKISNLRVVDTTINSRNITKSTNNKTGYTGVSVRKGNQIYYVASWVEDGVQMHKRFNPDKVGGEAIALALAVQAREDAIKRLNQLGYGYTDRHGESKD